MARLPDDARATQKAPRATRGKLKRGFCQPIPWRARRQPLDAVEGVSKPSRALATIDPDQGPIFCLTELELMKKGQWSSTKAMENYLHGADEGKRLKRFDAGSRRVALFRRPIAPI
jgi:hypothetical protein